MASVVVEDIIGVEETEDPETVRDADANDIGAVNGPKPRTGSSPTGEFEAIGATRCNYSARLETESQSHIYC